MVNSNQLLPHNSSVLTINISRGRSGDEVQDYEYNFTNVRRHSNSSGQGLADFKTKFETIEPEPVFEEELHGSSSEEHVTGSQ